MTPEELKTFLQNIVTEAGAVADIAAGVDPALRPFIAIGKAVASQIPGLVASVDSWIQGNPPSQTELDQLQADLKFLGNPDLP